MLPTAPKRAAIALVGEAPGEEEIRLGVPFVGASGQELTKMLREAGIDRSACFITNCLSQRPPGNDIKAFCVSKKELPHGYSLPPVLKGKYLDPKFLGELDRLRRDLEFCSPSLVITLGGTAMWALLGRTGIEAHRGVVYAGPGFKVLPTYHPAAVLRAWSLRPVVVADLLKAARESKTPRLVRPYRELWLEPTLSDILEFFQSFVVSAPYLAVDVETEKGQITCISFSPSPDRSICIPFWDRRQPNWSYWKSPREEQAAWALVQTYLKAHAEKVFQNGLYDLQYIWKPHGLEVRNASHDTMLLHHSLNPEFPKGLGFLGSIYTDEAAWKNLRTVATLKRDE